MPRKMTWNCHMVAKQGPYGCAAAIAYNDPIDYPAGGHGVEIATYSSDTGSVDDIAGALLDTFVKNAAGQGIDSAWILTDVSFCPMPDTSSTGLRVDLECTGEEPWKSMDWSCEADPKIIRRAMAVDALKKELDRLEQAAGLITFQRPPLLAGQYVLYRNGSRYEIGRVKRVTDDGAFVWYSAGETASKTPWDCLTVLENARNILKTDLGGEDARRMFPEG